MGLIELMIAMVVLAIGMAAGMGLIFTSILANSRNKRDTSATLVAQTVLEKLLWAGAAANTNLTITDCMGNALTVNPVGTTAGTGAAVDPTTGNINFSTAAPAGYGGTYTACTTNGSTIKYDVRWNLKILDSYGNQPSTKLVTVAARPQEANASGSKVVLWALPVTLRGVAALSSN
jgi:Tfp pilus assembly protein PilV